MSGLNSGIILELLKAPFHPSQIHWRVGATNARSQGGTPTKGIALAYIDARDVMERLDDVVGPENWQCRYPFSGCCEIGIKIGDEWVWKSNGSGDVIVRDDAKEEEQSMKEKGNYSDAMKRAAVMWGIGRYLYALPNVWVEIDQYKKIANPPSLPDWAIPSEQIDREKLKEVLVDVIKVCDSDDEDNGPAVARELFDKLTNPERIELGEILKRFKAGRKGYHSIFREYLTLNRSKVA